MNYKTIYDTIISKAKSSNRKKGGDVYYECHHILPKCLGGGNEKENLVLLTAREHYVCHKLLFRMYPDNIKLGLAYHSITYTMTDNRKLKLSSRDYEEARKAVSISNTGENNAMYGKPMSEQANKKRMETIMNNGGVWNKGTNLPKEQTDKMSKSALGKPKNETHKKNISKSKLGKKQSIEHIESRAKKLRGKKRTLEQNKAQSERMKGVVRSIESILKNSGENHWNFGKKANQETKSKQSLSKKLYWENIRQERATMIF